MLRVKIRTRPDTEPAHYRCRAVVWSGPVLIMSSCTHITPDGRREYWQTSRFARVLSDDAQVWITDETTAAEGGTV